MGGDTGGRPGWQVGHDLAAHTAAVGPLLRTDPVGHTTQATLLDVLATGVRWSDVPPVFVRHRGPDGRVDAAGVMTPPHPLVLDGAADPAGLVAALAAGPAGHAVAGVNALVPVAEAFTAAWCGPRGLRAELDHRLHLLALPGPAALLAPPLPAGVTVRAAEASDLAAVLALVGPMRAELGERGESPVRIVTDRIAAGLRHLAEDGSGAVATADASPAVAGVSRVSGVYTVPAARGRGCAAAVTAAVTRAAYAAGARHVCLFTDTANPTANGVYERLGYVRRPDDRVVLRFG